MQIVSGGNRLEIERLTRIPVNKGDALALSNETGGVMANVWKNKKMRSYELPMQNLSGSFNIVEVLNSQNGESVKIL